MFVIYFKWHAVGHVRTQVQAILKSCKYLFDVLHWWFCGSNKVLSLWLRLFLACWWYGCNLVKYRKSIEQIKFHVLHLYGLGYLGSHWSNSNVMCETENQHTFVHLVSFEYWILGEEWKISVSMYLFISSCNISIKHRHLSQWLHVDYTILNILLHKLNTVFAHFLNKRKLVLYDVIIIIIYNIVAMVVFCRYYIALVNNIENLCVTYCV